MADQRRQLGNDGEALVAAWLSERGHTVLARNWRASHLEIDLITLDGEGIHFVEVKTRRPPMQADPQESVNILKQRRIAKAAGVFLS
ncbi:MAG: YraN family protein [Bacteroidales bacterium]|nr:YraN family protein [Bacteroidales bacterium]